VGGGWPLLQLLLPAYYPRVQERIKDKGGQQQAGHCVALAYATERSATEVRVVCAMDSID
jgi:hypothetical protein